MMEHPNRKLQTHRPILLLSPMLLLKPMLLQRSNLSITPMLLLRPMLVLILVIAGMAPKKIFGQDAPTPPPMPQVSAVVGDQSVTLYWDDSAERHYDPFFESLVVYEQRVAADIFEEVYANPYNFEGYRVYKSTDPEFLDVLRITDNLGNPERLVYEASFDLINSINQYHPASQNGQRIWMGSDNGITRIWEDNNLINGKTYYYAVVSYTHGDALPSLPLPVDPLNPEVILPNEVYRVPPLESLIDIEIRPNGEVITGINVVKVVPRAPSAGYIEPVNPEPVQLSGTGSGDIMIDAIDPGKLLIGHRYEISFEDTLVEGTTGDPELITKNFTLRNQTTGETLFEEEESFDRELPVREGFRLAFGDLVRRVTVDAENSFWVTGQSAPIHDFSFAVSSRTPTAFDYEIEFFDEPTRTSRVFTRGSTTFPESIVNFIVTNTITGEEIDFGYFANPLLPRDFRAVAYLSEDRVLIGGAGGVILESSNGGETWTPVESGVSVRIRDFEFVDPQNGFAAGRGGVVIKTTDGGASWSSPLATNTETNLTDLFFLDQNTGFVSGEGGLILKTTDGGTTWESLETGITRALNRIHFVDETTGFASGFVTVLKTTDGGSTWQTISVGTVANFTALTFSDDLNGFVGGTAGRISRTTDGGTTWAVLDAGIGVNINQINFISAQTGWLTGSNGALWKTTDGGTTWTRQESGTADELFGVDALNGERVIAVGANDRRIRTFNGGDSWTSSEVFNQFRSAFDDNGIPRSDVIYFLEEIDGVPGDESTGLIDTWSVSLIARSASSSGGLTVNPAAGDQLVLSTLKPFTEADLFEFEIRSENVPSVEETLGADILDDIRVVPNPYLVTHIAETSPGDRQIHFTNLPASCEIRIFTVAGQLVQTLDVNNPFDQDRYIWDLKTKDGRDLAYGVYIYHVTAPGVGEKTGRFAVIK